jgi:hypothetical protein
MLRMITRLMAGWGVCVRLGIGVAEGVSVGTAVIVDTTDMGVDVAPAVNASDWHADRSINTTA